MIEGERLDNYGVKTGVEIVVVEDFRRFLERGGDAMRSRLFFPAEVAGADVESLAGMFAAKEAAFKALELPLGDWHVLEIGHEPSGRSQAALGPDYDSAMLSISI